MKEFKVKTTGRAIVLQWFGDDATEVKREAEECGHRVVSVQFVRDRPEMSSVCPGVVCKCVEGVFCPAHGKLAR